MTLRTLATGLGLSNRIRPARTEPDKDLADWLIQNVKEDQEWETWTEENGVEVESSAKHA